MKNSISTKSGMNKKYKNLNHETSVIFSFFVFFNFGE